MLKIFASGAITSIVLYLVVDMTLAWLGCYTYLDRLLHYDYFMEYPFDSVSRKFSLTAMPDELKSIKKYEEPKPVQISHVTQESDHKEHDTGIGSIALGGENTPENPVTWDEVKLGGLSHCVAIYADNACEDYIMRQRRLYLKQLDDHEKEVKELRKFVRDYDAKHRKEF